MECFEFEELQEFLYRLSVLLKCTLDQSAYSSFVFMLSGKDLDKSNFPYIQATDQLSNNTVGNLIMSEIYSFTQNNQFPMSLTFETKFQYCLFLLEFGHLQKARAYIQDILQSDFDNCLQSDEK